ncbi:MAG: enoyl-CoA hydratase-related protein [Pseudomonadota bacterium]
MTTSDKHALPETSCLKLDRQGSVLRIWLNQPENKNALSAQMTEELSCVLTAVASNRDIRTLVLRGAGGVFCAGGDIKSFKASMQSNMSAAKVATSNRSFGTLLCQLNEQPQTVILLIEGAAIGGGLGLACVGDVTIVTADAQLRLSETSLGIPPAQIAPFVCERIGLAAARRLMLTGARFNGAQACELGLAHFQVADADALESHCSGILKQINACSPEANAATKRILFKSLNTSRPDALDFAANEFADCMLGADGREGVAAFLEKRRPAWFDDND